MSVVTADEKGYADRVPTARLAQLLPQQRLYSSPDAQAGIIATDFSSVDIQMSIMNRHPTDQEKKPLLPFPGEPQHVRAATGSFPVDFPEPGQESGWRRLLPWAFGLVTLFALVLVVLHFGTIEEFTRLARAARPEWLFLVCVAQAATYVSASLVWRQALRRAGHPRSLSTLIPLGIAKLFTDQVVPTGGVSGAILVVRGLTRRGVPTNVAMAVLLVGLVAYFAAYLAAVLTSLGILWLHNRANAALFVVVSIFVVIVGRNPFGRALDEAVGGPPAGDVAKAVARHCPPAAGNR